MFEYLKKALAANSKNEKVNSFDSEEQQAIDSTKKLQISTAALFVEMAKADGDYSSEERKQIIELLKTQYNLDEECVAELLEYSETQLEKSISLYGFANIINEQLTSDEKFELVKNLWRLIYTDAKLDKYEDRLIKLIGGMLYLDHKKIIEAKMAVRDELGIE